MEGSSGRAPAYIYIYVANKEKCHAFLFIFSLLSYTKLENQFCLPVGMGEELAPVEGGKWWLRLGKRLNTVQKMCTHANKCKNDTC
jgi:hypothetical protein